MTKSYEIHPAIGIARLGSSDEYYLGPEPDCSQGDYDDQNAAKSDTYARTAPPSQFRDAAGNLKRQAVRFRVLEVDRDDTTGKILSSRELYGNRIKEISWTVHLANRKAITSRFLDSTKLRNPQVSAAQREKKLVIDGGKKTLNGPDQRAELDGGQFMESVSVPLGRAWTDAGGRLLAIGGKGTSGCVGGPAELMNFADNDYWYDDTSDGPVTASIKLLDDSTPTVVGAWLIVAPFDFAPDIDSFISLYDVVYQVSVSQTVAPPPAQTNFYRDVLPLLKRVRKYRWVNSATMRAETQDRHTSWRDETSSLFQQLANPAADPNADPQTKPNEARAYRYRKMLLAHLPDPANPTTGKREVRMPRLHDHQNSDYGMLPLTQIQYDHVKHWADGNFVADAGAKAEWLVDAVNRIALEACSGGAFYPGMETPRIMRDKVAMYVKPFPRLDTAALKPGEITSGLAVPWQADFFDCQDDGYAAWWPATRPDQVFTEAPQRVVDSQPEEMSRWDDGVSTRKDMVEKWEKLGIVRRTRVDPLQLPPKARPSLDTEPDGTFAYFEWERVLPR
jgi:hypothetical protein